MFDLNHLMFTDPPSARKASRAANTGCGVKGCAASSGTDDDDAACPKTISDCTVVESHFFLRKQGLKY